MSLNIEKSVLYDGILLFVLISKYGCFEFMSASRLTDYTFVLENQNVVIGSSMF